MTRRRKRPQNLPALQALVAPLDKWSKTWAGDDEDESIGQALATTFRSFLMHLQQQKLSWKTLRRHRDSLWLIGGEIIRALNDDPALRNQPPRQLLMDSLDGGQAPLVNSITEAEQMAIDATARKLLRFLAATAPSERNR